MEQLRGRVWRAIRSAKLRERRKQQAFAREVHDELGQLLVLITSRLATLQASRRPLIPASEIESILDLSREATASVRQIVSGLREPRSSGRVERDIRLEAIAVAQRYSLQVDCIVPGRLPVLGRVRQGHVIAFLREALANAARHSQARRLLVLTQVREGILSVSVQDDGQGLKSESVSSSGGLVGLQEIAEAVQGNLEIASTRGVGTRVRLSMPVRTTLRRVTTSERGVA